MGFFQYSLPPSPVYPTTKFPAIAASIAGSPKPSRLEKDRKIFDLQRFLNTFFSLKLFKSLTIQFFGNTFFVILFYCSFSNI